MASANKRAHTSAGAIAPNSVIAQRMQTAIREHDFEAINKLLTKYGSAVVDIADEDNGETSLHAAVIEGDCQLVHTLLSQEADLEIPDKQGCTPLHYAARLEQCLYMYLLLRQGAVVDALNKDLYTPLHFAASNKKAAAVRILVEHGADVSKRSIDGKTALDLAIQDDKEYVAEELKRSPSEVSADDAFKVRLARQHVAGLIRDRVQTLSPKELETLVRLLSALNSSSDLCKGRKCVLDLVLRHLSIDSRYMASRLMDVYTMLCGE